MKSKPLHELSETELTDLLANAEKTLQERQMSKHKEVLAEIKALAASIGVSLEIANGPSKKAPARKGAKVPIKYRNPENKSETWTGRGVTPKWLRSLMEKGKQLDDFRV
jgi:DNA-binding protein H-NS